MIDIQSGHAAYDDISQECDHEHAVDLHHEDVASLRVVGAVADREQERPERAHGGGFRWGREPEDDRAERRADEAGERQERCDQGPEHCTEWYVALLERKLWRELRIKQRHDDR